MKKKKRAGRGRGNTIPPTQTQGYYSQHRQLQNIPQTTMPIQNFQNFQNESPYDQDSPVSLKDLLISLGMQKLYSSFIENGFDTLEFLAEMTPDEWDEMAKTIPLSAGQKMKMKKEVQRLFSI